MKALFSNIDMGTVLLKIPWLLTGVARLDRQIPHGFIEIRSATCVTMCRGHPRELTMAVTLMQ